MTGSQLRGPGEGGGGREGKEEGGGGQGGRKGGGGDAMGCWRCRRRAAVAAAAAAAAASAVAQSLGRWRRRRWRKGSGTRSRGAYAGAQLLTSIIRPAHTAHRTHAARLVGALFGPIVEERKILNIIFQGLHLAKNESFCHWMLIDNIWEACRCHNCHYG